MVRSFVQSVRFVEAAVVVVVVVSIRIVGALRCS